jgi:hypothetical protein
MTRLRSFGSFGPDDRRALLEAWLLLVAVRLLLRPVPFSRLRAGLDRLARGRRRRARSVEGVAWSIGMTQPFVPRASCLTQALAGEVLLRRSGHEAGLHLGVRHAPAGDLRAHAWLESDGRIVTGGPGHERYAPLTRLFPAA